MSSGSGRQSELKKKGGGLVARLREKMEAVGKLRLV
jgi:hypothetical protein